MIKFHTILSRLSAPQACLCCSTPVYQQQALCEECENELPWQLPGCPQCGLASDEGDLCFNCRHTPPAFDRCQCVFAYEAPVTGMIKHFKDRGSFAPARCLASMLAASFNQHYLELGVQPDWLAPVPLHPRRLQQRGFNQSVWMAQAIKRSSGIPMLLRCCTREAGSHHQRGLGAQQRQLNMQGMFTAGRDAHLTAGRHIAIIDDVVTTTATVNAMSQVLRQQGAARIDVWALARVN